MIEINISEETKARIKAFNLPSYKEIPDVGLYLEQTTKFVSEYMDKLEGIVITGSMISNYVKKKVIANPDRKQYYRDHIAEIIFIAVVKSILSIEEAEKMLKYRRENYGCREAYEYFCAEFKTVLDSVFCDEKQPEPISEECADRQLLRRVISAAANKIYLNEVFKNV